jgi:hypothetical protein
VRHDAATLAVAEQVHGRAQRLLNDAGHHDRHEPDRRAQNLALAWVAPHPALHADRHHRRCYLLLLLLPMVVVLLALN